MGRMPEAEWRGPLPSGNYHQAGGRNVIGVTIHHMDGSWEAADATFKDPNRGSSACFGVTYEGHIIQWVDTDDIDYHACQAQWEGYVGIENESDPNNVDAPLTPAQVAADARIAVWLGVPPVVIVSRGQGGVGYHRQFPGDCSVAWGQTDCPGGGIANISVPAIVDAMKGTKPRPEPPKILEVLDVLYMFGPDGSEIWRMGDTRRHVTPGEWAVASADFAFAGRGVLKPAKFDQAWWDSVKVA